MSIEVNGVSLPDIPSEVLEQYPYACISYARQAENGVVAVEGYMMLLATKPMGVYASTVFTEGDAYMFGYLDKTALVAGGSLVTGETEWTIQEIGANGDLDGYMDCDTSVDYGGTVVTLQYKLQWSNYDIYVATVDDEGNLTATDTIYFARNDSDPNYFAPKSWYDGMARQVMRLTGTSDKLSTTEMLALLKTVEPATPSGSIYGVSWAMTSDPTMTRTDAAADFSAPVPSVNGSEGSSPFDNLMPWSGMQIVEDDAGSFVSIPKFWYKITKTDTAFQIQIADYAADGFSVSPAHADRGDGNGERDTVYIARYKCAGDNGYPVSGAAPKVNMTRAAFRSAIAASGITGYSIQDYAMLWTTRMLMVVEYATWDMQSAIGYNCGNGSAAENTGATDSMPYHTGTVQASLSTYGVGVQYRYIEDPWGNVAEWVDGWRTEQNDDTTWNVYVMLNPADFSDDTGGTLVGTLGTGVNDGIFIKDWTIPTAEGYEWALLPTGDMDGIDTGFEYVADYCCCYGPSLNVGGLWVAYPVYGPFCLASSPAGDSVAFLGARLQKIP